MRDYTILNVNGTVIGLVSAANPQAAVRAWNLANKASHEVATEAIQRESSAPAAAPPQG